MRISDWSSDVCSSDLRSGEIEPVERLGPSCRKEGMSQQRLEPFLIRTASSGNPAFQIHFAGAMRGDPVVDRPHARSSVETDDLAVRPGPAEIGDAAEVDDDRVRARPQVLQERLMIGNKIGRAMSSRANVRSEEHTSELQSLMR